MGARSRLQKTRGQRLRPRQSLRTRAGRGQADARPSHGHAPAKRQSRKVQVHSESQRQSARQVLVKNVRDSRGRQRVGPLANRRHLLVFAHARRNDGFRPTDYLHTRRGE